MIRKRKRHEQGSRKTQIENVQITSLVTGSGFAFVRVLLGRLLPRQRV